MKNTRDTAGSQGLFGTRSLPEQFTQISELRIRVGWVLRANE
jgi:hypothetical protein